MPKKPTRKENLGAVIKRIGAHKPPKMKSPDKMPSRAELRRKWRLIDGVMVEVIDDTKK